MGRKKIKIERIDDERSRITTFNKRKVGLLKKAMELSVLCDCDVMLVVSGDTPQNTSFQYCNKDLDSMWNSYKSLDGQSEMYTNDDLDDLHPGRTTAGSRMVNPKTNSVTVTNMHDMELSRTVALQKRRRLQKEDKSQSKEPFRYDRGQMQYANHAVPLAMDDSSAQGYHGQRQAYIARYPSMAYPNQGFLAPQHGASYFVGDGMSHDADYAHDSLYRSDPSYHHRYPSNEAMIPNGWGVIAKGQPSSYSQKLRRDSIEPDQLDQTAHPLALGVPPFTGDSSKSN